MISYKLWNREFGASAAAVGQTIRIHGQPYTIVGVAPAEFTGMVPLLAPEVWTPMTYVDEVEPGGIISTVPSPTGNTRLERRGQRWMFVKGRLEAGRDVRCRRREPAAHRQAAADRVRPDQQEPRRQRAADQQRAHPPRRGPRAAAGWPAG